MACDFKEQIKVSLPRKLALALLQYVIENKGLPGGFGVQSTLLGVAWRGSS